MLHVVFNRIVVVNRGEAAMRCLRAIAELRSQTGSPIESVALYTDAESTASFVRVADIAYPLGPASTRPYVDLAVLERALRETGADAAWVGWGFVSENPAFAELCDRLGVTFIGPSAAAMRRLGDKIGAKQLAEKVGVPVAPWSGGALEDLDSARSAAREIGYPLMLKAAAGGGGRGIRVLHSDDDLVEAFDRTRAEAGRSFGSDVVFTERLVTGARHVEVQIISDGSTAWALGVRDCSLQRRNQKVIEESACPLLDEGQVAELTAAAERLAVEVGYRGAATVEFLYQPSERLFAFLEVNTRLQVEHPVTESTTGFDLVKAQISVASGAALSGARPVERGHAIEARLNAEDPDRDFAPAPGRISLLRLPSGPGVRVDTGFAEGDEVPADFDSMIAKIVVYGSTREEAIGRLRRALADTTVLIDGGTTNKSFLASIVDSEEFVAAQADTGWIDRVRAAGGLTADRHAAVALVTAAIEAYSEEARSERQRLFSTAAGGRPQVQHDVGRPIELKLRGATYRLIVVQIGPDRFRISFEGNENSALVEWERYSHAIGKLTVNGQPFRVVTGTHGAVHVVEVDGVTHRVSRDEGGVVRSPAPSLVVATPVSAGDEVSAGAAVLVVESMKMETVLRAPFDARVTECSVTVGSQIEAGVVVLRLDPSSDDTDDSSSAATEIHLPAPPEPSSVDAAEEAVGDLRSVVLGFDVDPADDDRPLAAYESTRRQIGAGPHTAEVELLDVFADIAELSRNQPFAEEPQVGAHVHSTREHFHTYLQSRAVPRPGVPDVFVERLKRALGHYGVSTVDRSDPLEDAVFRLFLAVQPARSALAVEVITTVLRNWLSDPPPVGDVRFQAGEALERLVQATQVRFPVITDLARGVVFRWFAQPMLRRTRAQVYSDVRKHLSCLDKHPDAADAAERIQAMVACPEPLTRLVGQRITRRGARLAPLLEVMTRRYYRSHDLSDVDYAEVGGREYVMTAYDGRPLIASATDFAGLQSLAADLADRADASSTVDIYLTWDDRPSDMDAVVSQLRSAIAGLAHVQRVTTTVAGRSGVTSAGALHQHVTFRPTPSGLSEDRLIRGIHPLVAERLQLHRLQDFDMTRLPSADEDVYLFRCVARKNPSDERLIAMAQVRDLTPLRDTDGRLISVPAAEGTLDACLDAIRKVQAQRPARSRLDTNRVWIYSWPANELTAEELREVAHRVIPSTLDAGLAEVVFLGRQRDDDTGEITDAAVQVRYGGRSGIRMDVIDPPTEPVKPLDDYAQKVLRAQRRGTTYPYELAKMLGIFTEYDLVDGHLRPVERPPGGNTAAIVTGVARTPTAHHPDGVTRVVLLGDPTKSLGALSEPECTRIIGALDLADQMQVPVEWYALSAGAKIAMNSGTENLDWVARALKRIVEFTQHSGEINVVVAGINVGAQPYFNAEATMLMHTKGVLIMTPDSAMVLTGKQSLDFSGGVSAEDNYGIGGYDRVMGPNGQAQYWARNLPAARDLLLRHYDHTYVSPGETAPARVSTSDPTDRDVSTYEHSVEGNEFRTVGDIFSPTLNPDRKKPFDIRTLMRAVSDVDHPLLERWAGMADAQTAVVTDGRLGGRSVCLIGIESANTARHGYPPADGPESYSAGTLFPRSSKKVARAINAASGNRPVVVLANLSGFDGSPESMRKLQLEYGAEIGRAIVNFDGRIVFCVVSRYHGGAFVVFSKALNPGMRVLAVEGSFASVIGGAPAAAVVFPGEVSARVAADPRVRELEARLADTEGEDRAPLVAELAETRTAVRAEKLSEVAAEFDRTHSVERAVSVGSVDEIVPPHRLRPALIDALD